MNSLEFKTRALAEGALSAFLAVNIGYRGYVTQAVYGKFTAHVSNGIISFCIKNENGN